MTIEELEVLVQAWVEKYGTHKLTKEEQKASMQEALKRMTDAYFTKEED